MKKILDILFFVMAVMGVVACSNNAEEWAEPESPAQNSQQGNAGEELLCLLNADGSHVEGVSSEYRKYLLAVNTDEKWELCTDDAFIKINKTQGIGKDTVEVMIAENWWKERQGTIAIRVSSTDTALAPSRRGEIGKDGASSQEEADGTVVINQFQTQDLLNVQTMTSAIRGAGFSYRPNTNYCMGTEMQVFNIEELRKMQEERGISLVLEDFFPQTQQDVVISDSLENIDKNLSINATVNLRVQLFSFELKANFDQTSVSNSTKEFAVMRMKQCYYTREINYENAIALALQDNKKDYNKIFAPGFRYELDNFTANIGRSQSEVVRNAYCEEFVNRVGMAFVQKAVLGCVLDYYMSIDKSELSKEVTAGGTLSASFGQIFDMAKIQGGAQYTEKQKNAAEKSKSNLKVRGGDLSQIGITVAGGKVDYTDLQKWQMSVRPENAALIDVLLLPLYSVVPDEEARAALKHYYDNYMK